MTSLNSVLEIHGLKNVENKEGFDQGETVSVQTFHNNVNTDFSKQNNGLIVGSELSIFKSFKNIS